MAKTISGYSARKLAMRTAKRTPRRVVLCEDRSVETHELGEFSMSCYRCHMYADA